jgi:hypothetical protein
MSFRRFAYLPIALLLAGCGDEPLTPGTNDDLTAPDAVERTLTIQSYVYVDHNATDYTIENAVKRQIRTAFGPLRIAKISVDDREHKSNVDPSSFESTEIQVVKKADDGSVTEVKKVKKVSYTYRARALVNKSQSSKTSMSLALLMGNYQSFVSDIIHQCVENYEHDHEFSSSFWYVFAPNEYDCKQLIQDEVQEIESERQGLAENQIGEKEHGRRFLPATAKLETVAGPRTTYPEYDRLYGLSDAAKKKIVVYQIMGVASHAGDPDSETHENDYGFKEFMKEVKVINDKWSSLKVSSDSPVNPLKFSHDGQSYTCTFADLHKWIVDRTGYPSGITSSDDKQKFRRAIHDHLDRKWIRIEAPLTVRSGHDKKEMTLQIRMFYGTSSGWDVRGYFKEGFKNGDVVMYNGHSYIGSGPLDPNNYSASDVDQDRYQIYFFNSCVSFNYYGIDYFDMKQNGTQDLDLVTNGIEVNIVNGGMSMGQFVVALFDGQQHTWMNVLKKTQTTNWWGTHDPNRAVDGEQDNVYDPNTTPISVTEGWNNQQLEVQLSAAVCGSTASGTVQLAATAPGATRVEFYADGAQIGSDSSEPFSHAWDTTAVSDGQVEIKVRAIDGSGQTAEDSCTTTVQNGGSQTDLFSDDMESGSGNWTATGLWHLAQSGTCASPAYGSAVSAWYFGQDSGCNFKGSGAVKGTLTSRDISGVTASSKLSFKFLREVESTSSGSYDKTSVEVSGDGGSTWKALWSKDSSDSSAKAWKSSGDLSLAEFAGKTIQVRFSFDSVDDYANEFIGWMIDDVRVTP